MRWYTNNTKKVKSKKYGNYEYQKIEAKSRKTDGFFAFVAAMTQHELIPGAAGISGRAATLHNVERGCKEE